MQAFPKSRLLWFVEEGITWLGELCPLLVEILEMPIYTLLAHRLALSQGAEEYDVPDAFRRLPRDASDSKRP